jgi:molybdopterin-guanine dinucleotide biosynthesis protein A
MSGPHDKLSLGGVLVGGQSRRFGTDKALAHVGERSMAARAVHALRTVADPVVLLGGDGTLGRRMALPWRADEGPGRGPLEGIATGLRWALELGRPGLVVLACDLPLVTPRAMASIVAAIAPDLDAVVADGQPLCAWYSTRALEAVDSALDHGRHSVRELLPRLRVERVRPAEDPDEVLLNVNTPEDLIEAARHAMAQRDR